MVLPLPLWPAIKRAPTRTRMNSGQLLARTGDGRLTMPSPRALMAVVGASLAFFCTTGFMNAAGLFQDYYFEGPLHSKSAFDISWIGSFGMFAMFLFAAPAGMLTDKGGPMVSGLAKTVRTVLVLTLCVVADACW